MMLKNDFCLLFFQYLLKQTECFDQVFSIRKQTSKASKWTQILPNFKFKMNKLWPFEIRAIVLSRNQGSKQDSVCSLILATLNLHTQAPNALMFSGSAQTSKELQNPPKGSKTLVYSYKYPSYASIPKDFQRGCLFITILSNLSSFSLISLTNTLEYFLIFKTSLKESLQV